MSSPRYWQSTTLYSCRCRQTLPNIFFLALFQHHRWRFNNIRKPRTPARKACDSSALWWVGWLWPRSSNHSTRHCCGPSRGQRHSYYSSQEEGRVGSRAASKMCYLPHPQGKLARFTPIFLSSHKKASFISSNESFNRRYTNTKMCCLNKPPRGQHLSKRAQQTQLHPNRQGYFCCCAWGSKLFPKNLWSGTKTTSTAKMGRKLTFRILNEHQG